ncbi:MAG: GatB/YqeY domain-containing protein [Planctomycetota bacterium]
MAQENDIQARLTDDMKTAMKAGEKDRLQVIRMLLSDVKNADMTGVTPMEAVESYGKKLRKSVEEYKKYDDPDRVAALEAEYAVVEAYLPKKADATETRALVDAYLAENPADNFGRAMGGFMKAHGDRVDPTLAKSALNEALKN